MLACTGVPWIALIAGAVASLVPFYGDLILGEGTNRFFLPAVLSTTLLGGSVLLLAVSDKPFVLAEKAAKEAAAQVVAGAKEGRATKTGVDYSGSFGRKLSETAVAKRAFLSPDGKKLIVSFDGNNDLWSYMDKGDGLKPVRSEEMLRAVMPRGGRESPEQ